MYGKGLMLLSTTIVAAEACLWFGSPVVNKVVSSQKSEILLGRALVPIGVLWRPPWATMPGQGITTDCAAWPASDYRLSRENFLLPLPDQYLPPPRCSIVPLSSGFHPRSSNNLHITLLKSFRSLIVIDHFRDWWNVCAVPLTAKPILPHTFVKFS